MRIEDVIEQARGYYTYRGIWDETEEGQIVRQLVEYIESGQGS